MAVIGNFIVRGIAQWAKIFEENRDMEGFEGSFKDHDGAYTIDLIVDAENAEIYEDSGAAGAVKPAFWDEAHGTFTAKRKEKDGSKNVAAEGKSILRFKRKHIDTNKPANGGAPKVLFEGGVMTATEGMVGNGSDVEVKFMVYTTKMSNGTLLKAVRVLDLVEFKLEAEDDDEDDLPF